MSSRRSANKRVELASLLILLLLGAACGGAWSRHTARNTPSGNEHFDEAELTVPCPEFDPADVVRMQLEALGRFGDDHRAVAQCYAFASPANRQVTGPLTRFARMVLSNDFRPLVFQQARLVGAPIVKGDRAAVLASVIDAEQHLSIYCFYLSRQRDDAHRGCWMTDSVIRVPAMDDPPSLGESVRQPESV